MTGQDLKIVTDILNKSFERAFNGHRPFRQAIVGNLSDFFFGQKPIPFVVALALESTQFLSNQGEWTAAFNILEKCTPLAEKHCSEYVLAGFSFLRGRIFNQLGDYPKAEEFFINTLARTSYDSFRIGGFISLEQAVQEIKMFCQYANIGRDSRIYEYLSKLNREIRIASRT